MDIPFRKLKKSIAALLVGVLVANCASVDDYKSTEYEKYCLPFHYLSGSPSAYERTFIRDYPNKRDFTYTSDIGDTIISKGLVTHTKKTLITLKSEDVIYSDTPQIQDAMKSMFSDNELARMYQKSFSPGCESSQAPERALGSRSVSSGAPPQLSPPAALSSRARGGPRAGTASGTTAPPWRRGERCELTPPASPQRRCAGSGLWQCASLALR